MTVEPEIAAALTVMFFATTVRSTFGFGEAMIAMPLLTMLLSIKTAAPLIALTSTTIAAAIVAQDWRHIRFSSAWRLVLASLVGIPIGAYVLTAVPESVVKLALAIVVIGFATYKLAQPRGLLIRSDLWSYLFGFGAGVLGGAYNTAGPPLVIYGTFRGWSPEKFRATLQGFFFPTSLAIIAMHAALGRMTRQVVGLYVMALPLLAVSIVIGYFLNRRISSRRFASYVYVLLVLIGIALLVNSLCDMLVA